MPAKGAYLAIAGGGAVLLWSGLRGKAWTAVMRDLIAGKNPAKSQTANPILTASSPSSGTAAAGSSGTVPIGGAPNANAIAQKALSYQGHPYSFGGAPGPNGVNPWDCSSFANWVLGHDFRYTLPGLPSPGYNGATHGPTTLSYMAWTLPIRVATTTPSGAASVAQSGDILVDATHMGFAIGNGQMVSALNPSLGTTVTDIAGTMIAPTMVERL